MKNIRFVGIVLAILAVSCTNAAGKYVVEGNCEGVEDGTVVYMFDSRSRVASDSAYVSGGKFTFTGDMNPEKTCIVVLDRARNVVLVPDAAKLKVTLGEDSGVEGSPLTDKLTSFKKTGMKKYEQEGEDAYFEYCREVFEDNVDNIIGHEAFVDLMHEVDLDEFENLFAEAGDIIKSDEYILKLRDTKQAGNRTGEGSKMLDFEGVTPRGEAVKLSDYVGKSKLVLVDFWASWCGPCMRSMPAMKTLYEKYHGKGLEIVGVAVWDGDNSRSRARIDEKGMTWPQIFVGDDMGPTEMYGIEGIPHVILFDEEGVIITRGIPDEEKLDEVIEKRL